MKLTREQQDKIVRMVILGHDNAAIFDALERDGEFPDRVQIQCGANYCRDALDDDAAHRDKTWLCAPTDQERETFVLEEAAEAAESIPVAPLFWEVTPP